MGEHKRDRDDCGDDSPQSQFCEFILALHNDKNLLAEFLTLPNGAYDAMNRYHLTARQMRALMKRDPDLIEAEYELQGCYKNDGGRHRDVGPKGTTQTVRTAGAFIIDYLDNNE